MLFVCSVLTLVAIVGDFAVPYALAPFYKGYSHTLAVMSSLGNPSSPVRKCYNLWLILLGLLLVGASPLIWIAYACVSAALSIAVIVLILIFAAGAGILSGLFSVNAEKSIMTTASAIHGVGAAIGFMALLFVPLLLAILEFRMDSVLVGALFALCFLLALASFILFIMADKPEFQHTPIKYEGLWQRLSLLFMYLPLGSVAARGLLGIV